jgi:capsular exopolysaccharide synthesis family protein
MVLGLVLIATLGTYLVSKSATKRYTASAEVQVQPLTIASSLLSPGGQETEDPTESRAVAARLVTTPTLEARAAQKLRLTPANPNSLNGQTSVSTDPDSGFLTIGVEDPDPRRAAAAANALASALVEIRGARARAAIDTTISQLSQQGASPAVLQRLQATRAAQQGSTQIVQRALVPRSPASPRPLRNAALAFIVTLLIAVGLAFLLDRFDRRLRDSEDLAALAGTPLLSEIPSAAFADRVSSPVVVEAFRMLRTNLTYFNVDRPLKSVLVTSPLKADGKTTVATNLAKAMAQAGNDVIFVDADLRRPEVGPGLGMREDGLADVLTGARDIDEVVGEMEIDAGRLRILPSGAPPPNPSELLSSDRMRALLANLTEDADLVVIDTPPMLSVSDAIPLLGQVSGSILVGRLGRTSRDAIRRLAAVISNTGGVLFGVVATGSTAGGIYAYEAQEVTAADGTGPNGQWPGTAAPSRPRRRLGGLRARR